MRFSDCNSKDRWIRSLALVLTSCILLLSPFMPLGVPEEWVWSRHALPNDLLELADRLIVPVFGAALLLVVVGSGQRLLLRPSTARITAALVCLTTATGFWQTAVQQAAPTPHREIKPLWILYDKYASGYFFEAAFQTTTATELLMNYEDRMREGDVLHVGTHPPGLFLLSLAALRLTEGSPRLVQLLETIRSRTSEQSFRELEGSVRFAPPLKRSQLAALQLVSLLGRAAAACTVVPIFFLAAALCGRRHQHKYATGWRAASLYATIPAICIFMPRSDVIYPLTAGTFVACGCLALQSTAFWRQTVLAVIGAVILFAGMLMSLAHLPALIVLFSFTLLRNLNTNRQQRFLQLRILLSGLISFLICVLLWYLVTDCSLPAIWKLNLTNHAGFYDQSPRTWWKWFLVNPAELAFAVGWPLFLAAILNWKSAVLRTATAIIQRRGLSDDMLAFLSSCAVTWTLLWLSGKNMGEAARLWCFLTPWLAIAAAMPIQPPVLPNDCSANSAIERSADQPPSDSRWRLILLMQMVTAMITVGRVNGYSI